MDRSICIHGHFYQPPRENPWLEAVETQDSAHPYHDWNGRITAECYEPNATSRILDSLDRIKRIVNNYASISFNFGPTLLSWLQTEWPGTYAAVIEGDRMSRERFAGHGNAIAQAYNHTILPLANSRDKRTQVLWGLRDFEFRFGRKPEGMWLPEAAVDIDSLEALAAQEIAFTILEPHQARRIRRIGEQPWNDATGNFDPTQAYRCLLPSGRFIDLFFYDGIISRAVAFENLLARGEDFANRVVGAFGGAARPQLVHIATDGETYGHHHRFGDMALGYAIQYIEKNQFAGITNYALFLAEHPPVHEVEIRENTSWSCAHGVERWRSDCGCKTGAGAGWNQRWRKPLREALDWLGGECALVFEESGSKLFRDPWQARDEYIDVILDRSPENVERFLKRHSLAGGDSASSTQASLELLEMQRNAMLMFTSCGWFFNDLAGIETVQVLSYAARVIQLIELITRRDLEREFTTRLAEAQSNVPEKGNGRDIWEREVLPVRADLRRVAAHYAVLSLFDNFDDQMAIYCFDATRHDFEVQKNGRARLAVGSVTVRSRITFEEARFDFAVLHLGETELTGGVCAARSPEEYAAIKRELREAMQPGGIAGIIRLLDTFFAETSLSIRALFRDEQRRIFNLLCNTTLEEAESAFRQLHERYDPLMRFHTRLGIPVPKVLQMAAEFDLNVQIRRLVDEDNPPLPVIESRLREAKDEQVTLDETTRMALKAAIDRASMRFKDRPEDLERLEAFAALVKLVHDAGIDVDMRSAQNDYYLMRATIHPVFASSTAGTRAAGRWLSLFDQLGEMLNVRAEAQV